MATDNSQITALLEALVARYLDIPRSYYEKAVARHQSLGDWLCRDESALRSFQPHVSPQGSFRLGTVVRPLTPSAEYDLDNVTVLAMPKTLMTQKQLKNLYGVEVKAYARAHNMLTPVEEKNRCWRLPYADEVSFHLDTLPCISEEKSIIQSIRALGVPLELAELAVAITDQRHPDYTRITASLVSSNPRGFAHWFEQHARPFAEARLRGLVEAKSYHSVDDVPPYEWKTPLQRAIQILKRHRDVMFLQQPELGPISMIITNLATRAYAGDTDLWLALVNIVEEMPKYVGRTHPYVPNPTDPAEDYAEKWALDARLEPNFWTWHTQLNVDLELIRRSISAGTVHTAVRNSLGIDLTSEELQQLGQSARSSVVAHVARPVVYVPSPPRPWGRLA